MPIFEMERDVKGKRRGNERVMKLGWLRLWLTRQTQLRYLGVKFSSVSCRRKVMNWTNEPETWSQSGFLNCLVTAPVDSVKAPEESTQNRADSTSPQASFFSREVLKAREEEKARNKWKGRASQTCRGGSTTSGGRASDIRRSSRKEEATESRRGRREGSRPRTPRNPRERAPPATKIESKD